jgi:nucleotide-binding universal stress UspA family protein
VAGLTPVGTAEKIVEVGQPAEQIAAVAAERDAGLILLGLWGATGLLGPRRGSIAYRVLGLAKVPVLLAPLRRAEGAVGGNVPNRGRTGHHEEAS